MPFEKKVDFDFYRGRLRRIMELMYPRYRLEEAGYNVVIAGQKSGEKYHGKNGYPCRSDAAIADLDVSEFVVVICRRVAPDKLRRSEKVRSLVRDFQKAANWWLPSVTAAGFRFPPECIAACMSPGASGSKTTSSMQVGCSKIPRLSSMDNSSAAASPTTFPTL